MHEWITDCGLTPHVVVDATRPGVVVPERFVEDGRIVLNISQGATAGLVIGNEMLAFEGRFGGVSCAVQVPVAAVMAIYARENRQGMVFGEAGYGDQPEGDPGSGSPEPPDGEGPPTGRPKLKLVR
ncbi:MAG: ClpXP protease specificity-enhancing factor [Chromatiales bacterium]|nr:ClpXP protease specificity-enhancing factor [Chromatiales bacterium]